MPSGFQFSRDSDLTGFWSGEYWYSNNSARTGFSAHLEDTAGALSGSTLEVANVAGAGAELSADLTGSRSNSLVIFRKVYHAHPGMRFDPINYSGSCNEKFTVIQGEWVIPRLVNGGFIMHRASFGAKAEVRREAIVLQFKR